MGFVPSWCLPPHPTHPVICIYNISRWCKYVFLIINFLKAHKLRTTLKREPKKAGENPGVFINILAGISRSIKQTFTFRKAEVSYLHITRDGQISLKKWVQASPKFLRGFPKKLLLNSIWIFLQAKSNGNLRDSQTTPSQLHRKIVLVISKIC